MHCAQPTRVHVHLMRNGHATQWCCKTSIANNHCGTQRNCVNARHHAACCVSDLAWSRRPQGRHRPWAFLQLHSQAVASWRPLQPGRTRNTHAHLLQLRPTQLYDVPDCCCGTVGSSLSNLTSANACAGPAGDHSWACRLCSCIMLPLLLLWLLAALKGSSAATPSQPHFCVLPTCSHQTLLSHWAHHACGGHALQQTHGTAHSGCWRAGCARRLSPASVLGCVWLAPGLRCAALSCAAAAAHQDHLRRCDLPRRPAWCRLGAPAKADRHHACSALVCAVQLQEQDTARGVVAAIEVAARIA